MNNKFSENIKKIRKDNNLSQEQLADELGVSRQAISKWESSVAYPEMDKIITLCEKFNLNIDDLLHKDIKEVKGEEESKKKLNEYIDDFLNFITNSINMFSNMSFKSKCKCLFEQIVISGILIVVFVLIGILGKELMSEIGEILPNKLYYTLYSIIYLIYGILAATSSVVIIVHIFKTRYLDYYEKIKKNTYEEIEEPKKEHTKEKNKISLKKMEEKIIIRDPKHTEYRFINGLLKIILWFIKFFAICICMTFFATLISFFIVLVLSFLVVKTGTFFIGLFVTVLSMAIINIVIIILLLNFVFNRKNDKKKMIYSFLASLITFGIGCGLVVVGVLEFEYIENEKDIIKTEYIEFEMKDNLIFETYNEIEYIESDNSNIKIEYTINKFCEISHSNASNSIVHLWATCDNPLNLVKESIKSFNNKKIININNGLINVKIYTTKKNIEKLKKNFSDYTNLEIQTQNMINSYNNRISELELKISEYIQKEWEYKNEINVLKDQLNTYQNQEE